MPKVPRDKEGAAPKKRSRKTTPASGNGVHAENGNGAVATPITVSAEVVEVVTEAKASPGLPNLEEKIRVRAYEIYLQRGENHGSPEQDWLRAVEEICGRQRTA